MENSAKILLLGKTGVGKSSFINYFLGKDIAKSSPGKPVTMESFIPYEIKDGQYPIEIFDTKGLESLNAMKQLEDIINGIKMRNHSNDIFNWFHTIFYCISFSNSRFEDFEVDFINKLRKELTQNIHIIITHCDNNKATPENILEMRKKIQSDLSDTSNIEIFEVISIRKKKLNGQVVEPRGKKDISERVFKLLLEDVAYKISYEYSKTLRNSIDNTVYEIFSKLDDFIDKNVNLATLIGFIKDSEETDNILNTRMDKLFYEVEYNIENIKEETDEEFTKILKPVAKLYSSYYGLVSCQNFVEDSYLDFSSFNWIELDWINNLNEKEFISKIMPNISKYFDEFGNFQDDNLSFFSLINMIGSGIGDLLSLKKNVKHFFCEMKNNILYESIPSQEKIQSQAYERIIQHIK